MVNKAVIRRMKFKNNQNYKILIKINKRIYFETNFRKNEIKMNPNKKKKLICYRLI